LDKLGIKRSSNLSLRQVLQDPLKISDWINLFGLPNENLSI